MHQTPIDQRSTGGCNLYVLLRYGGYRLPNGLTALVI